MSKLSRRWRRLRQAVNELGGATYELDGAVFDLPSWADDIKRNILRGNYEKAERSLVNEWIAGDRPVVELGGSFGIVSGVTARRLSPESLQVVVEANPILVKFCQRNAQRQRENGAPVVAVHAAVAYGSEDHVEFVPSDGFLGSRLAARPGEAGAIRVPAISLSRILGDYLAEGPYDLICDIEGAEFDLFRHDAAGLERCRVAIVEFHPEAFAARGKSEEAFLALMDKAGFEIAARKENVVVGRRRAKQAGAA
jgi:FkbM family methyltransferase